MTTIKQHAWFVETHFDWTDLWRATVCGSLLYQACPCSLFCDVNYVQPVSTYSFTTDIKAMMISINTKALIHVIEWFDKIQFNKFLVSNQNL